ncbi:hypothetical protein [Lactobacillus hominis]|uniref:Phage protein n=1 Tax=Lactobacillus hominis DSM 23910 = CRBIP 24.179 TaxID=1423758 RepID=I7L6G8_9LACO|nr:hypothetical protein [Lactobacillus hominis]KRM85753.1 Phage related protein [Lactobacillus hominis DSM 23910 = CRBIP 24.179]MCT3347199.1 hypothetical protein [Lactobacillus hominis]CCI81992.1 Putative uncharacterized protein orf41 [Lactobacillus hominis DSM 23910 = CRBIP 24.179]
MSYFNKLRRAIPLLWTDRVTIIGTKPVKHGAITNNEAVTLIKDEPCKIILKNQKAGTQSFYGADEYDAKMIIRNGINIPAGVSVVVTDQNGQVTKYKRASKGYTGYYSHQEVALTREEKA